MSGLQLGNSWAWSCICRVLPDRIGEPSLRAFGWVECESTAEASCFSAVGEKQGAVDLSRAQYLSAVALTSSRRLCANAENKLSAHVIVALGVPGETTIII